MASILKTDEIQSQNGGAVVKMQTLKHPSASGNNLTLTASGGIKVPDGGNIGSASDPDAISISSSGYVVDSARPYFQYKGAGANGETITDGSRAQFDVEIAQRGNNYNTTSWFFTTPIAGVYFFGAQLYTYNNTGSLQQWRIASENTSNADEVTLTTNRITSATIGDILVMSWMGYVPVNRRISIRNSSSGNRNLYMDNVAHSQWYGALIG